MKSFIQYLAALAPEPAERGTVYVRRKVDLLLMPDIEVRPPRGTAVPRPLEFHHNDKAVERFAKLDALTPDETLLRLGFLWLAGHAPTEDGKQPFLMPIVSATVKAHGYVIRMNELELVTDFEMAPELGSPDARDVIEEQAQQLMLDYLVTKHPRREERLAGFARTLAATVGLPEPALLVPDIHPFSVRQDEQLRLSGALCLYLARDPGHITMRSTLGAWADTDVSATAFASAYRADPVPTRPTSETLDSPMLLNAAQRDAVRHARVRNMSAISGPPGTGKTHTAAAIALDEIARGRSVLVATQSDHAADVITEHLRRIHARGFIRFGSNRESATAVDQLAAGVARPTRRDLRAYRARHEEAATEFRSLVAAISGRLAREAAAVAALHEWIENPAARDAAPRLADKDLERLRRQLAKHGTANGWWSRVRMRRIRDSIGADRETLLSDIERAVSIEEAERLAAAASVDAVDLDRQWEALEAAASSMRHRYATLIDAEVRARSETHSDRAVEELTAALRSGRRERRRLLRTTDLATALEILPLWIGTLGQIDDTLPAIPGLFDLVIFDEASQIEQLHSATALMRARRAVVAGDPRQLRHVSFLSDERMDRAAAETDIPYDLRQLGDVRRNSLFDVAAAAGPVHFLEEHFRSVPHIIDFSSRTFYADRLRLMTQHPRNEGDDAIQTVRVAGERGPDGVNRAEVAATLELLATSNGSIGVVSPFRAQAEAIEEAIIAQYSADEITSRRLKVGTAHAMQGSEHDTMIISLAVDPATMASRRFVEDPNLFNTMITRARDHQIVLTSFDEADLRPGLLLDYLHHAEHPPSPDWKTALPSGWAGQLGEELRLRGLRVVPDYEVAGWTIDLAAGSGAGAVGVICHIHPDGQATHIERQSALHRAGWELIDAFESVYLANPEEAVEQVVARVLLATPP